MIKGEYVMRSKSVLLMFLIGLLFIPCTYSFADDPVPKLEVSINIYKIVEEEYIDGPFEYPQNDWHYYLTVQDGGLVTSYNKSYFNRLRYPVLDDDYTFPVYNKLVKVIIDVFDEDNYTGRVDLVDISSYPGGGTDLTKEPSRTCQFVGYYDLVLNIFTQGDQYEKEDGYYKTSGDMDGSEFTEENDASLWFKIEDNYEVPVADAGGDRVVAIGELVNFDATSSTASEGSTIVSYEWNFNDGMGYIDRGPETSYTFDSEGEYTVRLKVTDSVEGININKIMVYVGNAPPTPSFIYSPDSPSYIDLIQFNDTSTDADGQVRAWLWDFGDGHTSTEKNPNHKYSLKGIYDIKFTAIDNDGMNKTLSIPFEVQNKVPYADYSFSPDNPLRSNEIQFYDESLDYENSVMKYFWDFGDGSNSSNRNPIHTFTKFDVYRVIHEVEDEDGNKDTREINITIKNTDPIADFTLSTMTPKAGQVIQYIDTSSDPEKSELTYQWNFGDGQLSDESNPTHVYMSSGLYDIRLNVTDDEGLSDTKSIVISVIQKFDLTVKVTDVFGMAVGNADVALYRSNDYIASRMTDGDGNIIFYDLSEGNYRIDIRNLMMTTTKYFTLQHSKTENASIMLSLVSGGVTLGILGTIVIVGINLNKIKEILNKK